MKYKNIDSAIHNFGHSFMSAMNYVDHDYVMDDVRTLASREPFEVQINFSTGVIHPPADDFPRLMKSVALNKGSLSKHLSKHGIDPSVVSNVTLQYRPKTLGAQIIMTATDNRGGEHRVVVADSI